MSTAYKRSIGKTLLEFNITGCYSCGTDASFAWYHLFDLPIKIGRYPGTIGISLCGECKEKGVTTRIPYFPPEQQLPFSEPSNAPTAPASPERPPLGGAS